MPLAQPPLVLDEFPAAYLGDRLYRIHREESDALYFSTTGAGRFDLIGGDEGTLYAALNRTGALIEVFRSHLIPLQEVEVRRVATLIVRPRGSVAWRIVLPDEYGARPSLRLADCTAGAARGFGVTAAIHATSDYGLCQRWARAFRGAGFEGIRYHVSHDPSSTEVGLAIFGHRDTTRLEIEREDPIEEALLIEVQERFGMIVLPTPG